MSDFYLFRSAIRDLTHWKRLSAVTLLVIAPAVFALLIRFASRREADPLAIYNFLAPALVFGFVLVIMAIVFSTGVVSQEIEQKTIVYLMTHPLPRWRILLVKFIAALLATIFASWLALTLVALVTLDVKGLSGSPWERDMAIMPVGALAYGSVFLLLATLISRPLLLGLLFAFLWESWVPNLPGRFQWFSLMTYLRVLAPHTEQASGRKHAQDIVAMLSPQTISATTAWIVLSATIMLALILAFLIFTYNEYVPKDET